jgi:ketosteroid isomerase-like protein
MKKLLFSAVIAASLFSCQSYTKSSFDLAKAKSEIEAANREAENFMANGDSVGIASIYSTDGYLMADHQKPIKGKENLIKAWGAFIRNTNVGGLKITTMEVWGDENYLTEEGVFVFKTKSGESFGNGKYLIVWKKENGKWKVHREMNNSDLPQ